MTLTVELIVELLSVICQNFHCRCDFRERNIKGLFYSFFFLLFVLYKPVKINLGKIKPWPHSQKRLPELFCTQFIMKTINVINLERKNWVLSSHEAWQNSLDKT